jgi:uncharacterized sulfatase
MKSRGFSVNISLGQTNFLKGVGILLIVFHNYFHWVLPTATENEFEFASSTIFKLFRLMAESPADIINLLFSYFGHFGVQIFIFISGYGLTKSYLRHPTPWKNFLKHRVSKIYPSLLIGIFVLFLFYLTYNHGVPDKTWWRQISFKVLMLHTLIPHEALSINGPWWFYSLIFQLYLLFPILLKVIRKWKFPGFLILSAISYLLIFLFIEPLREKDILLMANAPGHLPEFALGIYLALNPKLKISKLWLVIAAILFTLGNFYYAFYPFTFISIAFLIVAFFQYLTNRKTTLISEQNAIVRYGVLSMYVFAVHGFFRPPFTGMASELKTPGTTILYAILFFITITGVSIASRELYNTYQAILKWFKNFENSNRYYRSFNSLVTKVGINKTIGSVVSTYKFLALLIIVNRILMMIWLKTEYTAEASDYYHIYYGIWRDLVYSAGFMGLLSVPLIVLGLFSQKASKSLLILFTALFAMINGGFSYYYLNTQVPLDEVIFYYSFKESLDIISSSGGFNFWSIVFTVFPGAAIIIRSIFIKKTDFKQGVKPFYYLLLGSVFMLNTSWMNPKEYQFDKDRHYYESVNYINYFIHKIKESTKNKELKKHIDLKQLKDAYHKMKNKLHFFNKRYAFLHDTKYPDVLSPYFKPFTTDKPNFVFILVESLGSAYSGPEAKTLSVTPFVDSLAAHSLYWPNCLSGAERTFGVLPAVFSSFTSFTDAKNNMPAHMSILQNYDSLGYDISFFYGGDANFNGMKQYILFNGGKLPIVNTDMTVGTKSEDPHNNWGWDDKTLFRTRINKMPLDEETPFVDIYLTLSSHAPYTYPDKPYWEKRYLDYISKLDAPQSIKENFKKYKEPMAAVQYADDALRIIFDFYKRSGTFDNTIFIITGDHHIGVIPTRNSIDKYNVPLIIYSSKLKHPETFKSVVSQFDITPSLQAFLRTITKQQIPYYVHWMGTGLETAYHFSAHKRNIFVRNSREINELIYDSLYISNNRLFRVEENLDLAPYNNKETQNMMNKYLEDTKDLFKIAVQQNMIIPYKFQKDREKVSLDIHTFADFEGDTISGGFDTKRVTSTGSIDGKRSIVLKPDMLYGPIGPDYYFDENYRKIEVKVSFDYKIIKGPKKGTRNPSVIIEFGKDKIWYKGISVNPEKYNEIGNGIYHFAIDEVYRPDRSIKWNKLKVYLYNPDKASMVYDNVEYQLLGIP